jgi:hypothetical protein
MSTLSYYTPDCVGDKISYFNARYSNRVRIIFSNIFLVQGSKVLMGRYSFLLCIYKKIMFYANCEKSFWIRPYKLLQYIVLVAQALWSIWLYLARLATLKLYLLIFFKAGKMLRMIFGNHGLKASSIFFYF